MIVTLAAKNHEEVNSTRKARSRITAPLRVLRKPTKPDVLKKIAAVEAGILKRDKLLGDIEFQLKLLQLSRR